MEGKDVEKRLSLSPMEIQEHDSSEEELIEKGYKLLVHIVPLCCMQKNIQ